MLIELDSSELTVGQISLLRSKQQQVLLAGGYGAGKTLGLSLKLLQLVTENPGVPGLLVAPTRPLLFSVTVRRLLSVLRRCLAGNQMPKIRDPQNECFLDFGDGVPVFLRSATRPDSIDGLDVGWACGDEIRYWDKQAYDITLGRVRVPCPLPQSAFASTPSIGWMADEFDTGKEGRQLIISGTRENEKNLSPGFIDNLRQSYSPRMQRAVIDGEFTILEGAVYEQFDPNPNTSKWIVDVEPTKDWLNNRRVFLSIDPGYRKSAWMWIAENKPLEWIVFDEFGPDNMDDWRCVETVNARKHPVDEIWCDPAGDATQSSSGFDTFAVLKSINVRKTGGIRVIEGFAREIPFGVDKLRVLLGGYEGLPIRIKFAKRLCELERGKQRGVVRDLAALRYPEIKDGRPTTDQPLKDGLTDHFCDAMRYFAVGRWMVHPELRSKDKRITESKQQGWKVAA